MYIPNDELVGRCSSWRSNVLSYRPTSSSSLSSSAAAAAALASSHLALYTSSSLNRSAISIASATLQRW